MATPEQRADYLRQLLLLARVEGAADGRIVDVAFDYGRSAVPGITRAELEEALQRERARRAAPGNQDGIPGPAAAIQAAVELAEGPPGTAGGGHADVAVLYSVLMTQAVGPAELQRRVRELYAAVVADSLRSQPFAADVAAQLEQGTADPQHVVSKLGLGKGALLAELRSRLLAATGDDALSRALALLLSPGMERPAWNWLAGGHPSQLMAEHGIPGDLGTRDQALKALGAVARLHGVDGPRLPEAGPEPGASA